MPHAAFALSRRDFAVVLPGLAAAGVLARRAAADDPAPAVHDAFPAQDPALVRAVVGASHANYEAVRKLVEASPTLAKASWDWGFGDWESALGAASHTGRRKIAELLIANGARPNIFSAAMLGQLEVVRAFVESHDGPVPVQSIPGPHGITLMRHARAGGERAAAVVAYLESVGGADQRPRDLAMSEGERDSYLGTYAWGAGADERVDVVLSRQGMLAVKRGQGVQRNLFHQGDHAFHPAGAEAVRVVFGVEDGRPMTLTVHDPEPILVARRA